jgi:ribosomal protein S18 acetylase RimI-like enzyme
VVTTTIEEKPELQGKLVYLASEDIRVAASLLFQAYKDDPIFSAIFNADKEGYEARLRAAIREELAVFWQSGQPMFGYYEGDTLEGVVCLTEPSKSFGPGRYWHWRLKMLLTAGYLSTRQMVEKEQLVREAMPVDNYHMLAFIAVHPRYQQHGLGELLVRAVSTVLQEDTSSAGVAVLVTRPEYERFLASHGYRPLTTIEGSRIQGQLMFLQRGEADAV